MTLYHVNTAAGTAGVCEAKKRACPFGESNHYTSLEAAEAALGSGKGSLTSLKKNPSVSNLVDSIVESNGVTNGDAVWLKSVVAWSRNERKVLTLLEKAAWADRNEVDFETKTNLMRDISGLHFIKEALTKNESIMLEMLERLQKNWLKQRRKEREAAK